MDQQTPNVAPQPAAPGGVEYAPHGARILASLIDGAIVTAAVVVGIVLNIIIGFVVGSISGILATLISVVLWIAIVGAILAYFPYYHAGPKQATIGKSVMGIMVVDLEGKPLTMGKAIVRLLCMMIPLAPLFVLFNDEHQGLHDKIAETYVITGKVA